MTSKALTILFASPFVLPLQVSAAASQHGNAHAPVTHAQPVSHGSSATHGAAPTHGTTTHGPTTTHGSSATAHGHVATHPSSTTHGSSASHTSSAHGSTKNTTAASSPTTRSTGATSTTALTPVQQKLAKNTQLASKLQSRMPAGTDLQAAAAGFRNLGQFVAAVNVSHNLGIPFNQLKTDMVTKGMSLGQSIQDLRPAANSTTEAQRAETDADRLIRTTTTPTTATSTTASTGHVKTGSPANAKKHTSDQ